MSCVKVGVNVTKIEETIIMHAGGLFYVYIVRYKK